MTRTADRDLPSDMRSPLILNSPTSTKKRDHSKNLMFTKQKDIETVRADFPKIDLKNLLNSPSSKGGKLSTNAQKVMYSPTSSKNFNMNSSKHQRLFRKVDNEKLGKSHQHLLTLNNNLEGKQSQNSHGLTRGNSSNVFSKDVQSELSDMHQTNLT